MNRLILRNVTVLLILFFSPLRPLLGGDDSRPRSEKLEILFISSFSKDLPAQADFEEGLNLSLNYTMGIHNVYFEFLDNPRIPEKDIEAVFADYLEQKYRGKDFDYIVLWATSAERFFKSHGELFPESYRIYVESSIERIPPAHPDHASEIVLKSDYTASVKSVIDLAEPEHFYVIGTTNNKSAQNRISRFNESMNTLGSTIPTTYLLDKPLDELANTLQTVQDKKSVVFYLLLFDNGKGKSITPYLGLEQLAENSAIPVFSFWESLMGSGMSGGHLISIKEAGKKIGRLILTEEKPGKIVEISIMRNIYDWTSVKRYKLPKKSIPKDSLIINRPPDILKEYPLQIFSYLTLLVILIFLVFYLLQTVRLKKEALQDLDIERNLLEYKVDERTKELKRANEELHLSKERYRSLSDASLEGIVFSKEGVITDVNAAVARMFDYTVEALIGTPITSYIAEKEQKRVFQKIRDGQSDNYETLGLKKDGTTFPVEINAKVFEYNNEKIRITAVRDLTTLKEQENRIHSFEHILPVCSSCKKIKDSHGRWQTMEEYMSRNEKTEISHGLCDECAKKLYPDFMD